MEMRTACRVYSLEKEMVGPSRLPLQENKGIERKGCARDSISVTPTLQLFSYPSMLLYWSFDLLLLRRESKIIIRVQTKGVHDFCFYMRGKKVK
ncbi:hypothetical protein NC653_039379 [Populus alba x Populus x berolinensis]|uniref:Uncharacterized protein n=1 Tax=Populus alba x Populus x berolinensis TaxID=444605 RepID=A0AAD6LDN1_9ROSI|nr:hypothetical protein NC653_039379 [Populus alba x Populus x berolinensis]